MCGCRTGCRQVFIATSILNLNIVGVVAVEVPQIALLCQIFCSICYFIYNATIVVKVLSTGILEVKRTCTLEMQEFLA